MTPLQSQETHSIPGRSTKIGLQYIKSILGTTPDAPLMRTRTRKRILKKLGPHRKRAITPARERPNVDSVIDNPAFTEVFLNFKRKPGSQQGTRVSLVTQFQAGRASLNSCYFIVLGWCSTLFLLLARLPSPKQPYIDPKQFICLKLLYNSSRPIHNKVYS